MASPSPAPRERVPSAARRVRVLAARTLTHPSLSRRVPPLPRCGRGLVVAFGCLTIASGVAWGADDKPAAAALELPARVETRHTINLAAQPLDYRAVAETIGLTDQKGEPVASVYTVSYLADAPAGTQRPVAF